MKRKQPPAACEGKETMMRKTAVRVAANMRKRHERAKITAYWCPTCDGWHVGGNT